MRKPQQRREPREGVEGKVFAVTAAVLGLARGRAGGLVTGGLSSLKPIKAFFSVFPVNRPCEQPAKAARVRPWPLPPRLSLSAPREASGFLSLSFPTDFFSLYFWTRMVMILVLFRNHIDI